MRTDHLHRIWSLLLVLALAALLPAALHPVAALAERPLTRESLVLDEAGVIDDAQIINRISALPRPEAGPADLQIAVLVSDDLDASDYDASVAQHVRERANPEVVSAVSGDLAPHTLLIVLSPELRKVGAYASEDLGLRREQKDAVTGAMKPAARDARWSDAVVAGAQAYVAHDGADGSGAWARLAPHLPWVLAAAGIAVAAGIAAVILRRRAPESPGRAERRRRRYDATTERLLARFPDSISAAAADRALAPYRGFPRETFAPQREGHLESVAELAGGRTPTAQEVRDRDLIALLQGGDLTAFEDDLQYARQMSPEMRDRWETGNGRAQFEEQAEEAEAGWSSIPVDLREGIVLEVEPHRRGVDAAVQAVRDGRMPPLKGERLIRHHPKQLREQTEKAGRLVGAAARKQGLKQKDIRSWSAFTSPSRSAYSSSDFQSGILGASMLHTLNPSSSGSGSGSDSSSSFSADSSPSSFSGGSDSF